MDGVAYEKDIPIIANADQVDALIAGRADLRGGVGGENRMIRRELMLRLICGGSVVFDRRHSMPRCCGGVCDCQKSPHEGTTTWRAWALVG
jgi:hypothetical protein